jgi:Domain of unknown function (DUF222)
MRGEARAQRRADAMGAFGAGSLHLACQCGRPDCQYAADDGRESSVVVHLYAEEAALAAEPDPLMDGDDPLVDRRTPEDGDRDGAVAERDSGSSITVATEEPGPVPAEAPAREPAGFIPGFGIVSVSLLAAMIARGAKVRFLQPPGVDPEPVSTPPALRL